ncbi:hypothetical protein BH18ACT11_BH18ACT11_07340 [soil metagenome]
MTGEEYFETLDSDNDLNWFARKGVRAGDLVFVYRTAPRSAITDVFEVTNDSYFDPWGKWDGFWMDMSRVCRIDDIAFAALKNDGVLGEWGAVRKRFHGIVVESVPPSVYNRLLEKIPGDIRTYHNLEPEPTAGEGLSGRFAFEADFADQVIEPLLRQWGFRFEREYQCEFFAGSQSIRGRVDYFVNDARGPITLFENKRKILDEKALNLAVDPEQCGGRPCIRGMRIRVSDVLDLLASGLSTEQIVQEMPDLEPGDIHASLRFASRRLDHPTVVS